MINPLLKLNSRIPGLVKKVTNPLTKIENSLSKMIPWNVVSVATSATVLGKGLFDAFAPNSLKKQKFYIEYEDKNDPVAEQWNVITDSAYTVGVKKQMYFDAVFRTEHLHSRQITSHPVHTQANISDHSYKIPETLTMEVGVSDVMGNFNPLNIIMGSAKSKSENAFQKLLEISDSGEPVTVYTRLRKYSNMIIESVRAKEDYKSINEMRAQINFQKIIIASGVGKTTVSNEAFTTGDKDAGVVPGVNFTYREGSSVGRIFGGTYWTDIKGFGN